MSGDQVDYYWTPYDGATPADAVEGGVDPHGETFYIASVYLKLVDEQLSGMIIPSTQTADITSFFLALKVKNDPVTEVKILRCAHKEAFEWIPTTSENLHLLRDHHLVPGGRFWGQGMYIGRIHHNGGVLVGKVFKHKSCFQGLWVPLNGTFFHTLSYEVLAYDPKKKVTEKAGQEGAGSTLPYTSGQEGAGSNVTSFSGQEQAGSAVSSLSGQEAAASAAPSLSGQKEVGSSVASLSGQKEAVSTLLSSSGQEEAPSSNDGNTQRVD
ncbi:uncharacterized protein [Tenebrio molitor]|jgi:hypothetical protein|uniref:uncharacterized protein n=1 Tax=Tenebrio molitor TaxID=7067 RepID=UPI0036248C91